MITRSKSYFLTLHKQDHPTKAVLDRCWEHGPSKLNSFGQVGNSQAGNSDLSKMSCPTVDIQIANIFKSSAECAGRDNMVQFQLTVTIRYDTDIHRWFERSGQRKDGGSYIYISIKKRTSDHLVVFTVEFLAILLSLL